MSPRANRYNLIKIAVLVSVIVEVILDISSLRRWCNSVAGIGMLIFLQDDTCYRCPWFNRGTGNDQSTQITTDIKYFIICLRSQFGGYASQFCDVRLGQCIVRRHKIRSGILPPRAENCVKKTVFQIILMRHIPP